MRGAARGCFVGAVLAGVVGCASGPQFDGQTYRGEQVSFRVGPLPGGFRRIGSDDALLTFRNDQAGASLAINARCRLDGDDVPLRALVQHLFLQFTERRELSQRSFTLDGREALEVQLLASLDGVQRRFTVTVFKKNECVYDFLLVSDGGEQGNPAVEADYRKLVEGFATLEDSSP